MAFNDFDKEIKRKNLVLEIIPNSANTSVLPIVNAPAKETNRNFLRDEIANPGMIPLRLAERNFPNNKNLNNPKINEVSNLQRDVDLGKITSSTTGNTNTYSIGGNNLSYNLNDNDRQLKTNLERINQIVASGANVSPEQMSAINELRQQAGYLRGGTDQRPVGPDGKSITNLRNINAGRVGNLEVQFTDSPDNTDQRKREFLTPSSYTQSQIDLIRPTVSRNIPGTNQVEVITGPSVEDKRLQEDSQRRKLEMLALDPEMANVASQIKLRDIQGKVAQEPPAKENTLKPIILTDEDPVKGKVQRIVMPNAEGTGYVDQAVPSFPESKEDIIKGLLKMRESKDPRLALAEAKYKAHFGSLPY